MTSPLDRIDVEGLKAELVEAQSHTAYYAKTLLALRDTLFNVADDLQDEGDRVYFGSTNDADRLKDVSGQIDDLAWEEIMADSQPPLNLYDSIDRGNAEREALGEKLLAAEARIAELIAQRAALVDTQTFILPMAKGYAAANRVGRNAEMIAEADALLSTIQATGGEG